MHVIEKGSRPLHTVHIDYVRSLSVTKDNYKHILLAIDAFTNYTWLFATLSTGTEEVIKNLRSLFDFCGNPRRIISDKATAFTAEVFQKFLKSKNSYLSFKGAIVTFFTRVKSVHSIFSITCV